MDSVLLSVKKVLGLEPDYTHFDPDIILHINTMLMTMTQLGVPVPIGFSVEDDTATWTELTGGLTDIQAVKSYLYLKVRLIFDQPATSFVIEAMERQAQELEWRIIAQMERSLV